MPDEAPLSKSKDTRPDESCASCNAHGPYSPICPQLLSSKYLSQVYKNTFTTLGCASHRRGTNLRNVVLTRGKAWIVKTREV